jgi:Acyl-CoA dehydrogenase, C-terminal domain
MVDVIEASERDLMAQTLRRLAEEFDGAPLSKGLADSGFVEVLDEAPREAVSTLFDALGRAGSMSTALQDVLLQPLAGVLGGTTAAHIVVLPRIGAALAGSLDGDAVTLRGLVIGQRPATVLLAPVAARGETAWVSIADPSVLSTRVVAGLDPAVAHACDRVQFGRPIGSFQGVRNRLAEAYVAWTAAAAALELAWEADDEYLAGMLAKSLAGRAARIAATHCQQVLAGIGFTAEHPFHRYLARALVLDSVLGSAVELRRAIGQQLVSTGTIPRLVEL